MNKFECACGHSFNDKNNGEVQRLLIQRTYEPSSEQRVELIFQIEEWRKVITKSKRTHNYSLLDIIILVVEEIWEEISEENDYDYGELHMTSSDGDYTTISIESEEHLKDSIISARIVGYKQTEG